MHLNGQQCRNIQILALSISFSGRAQNSRTAGGLLEPGLRSLRALFWAVLRTTTQVEPVPPRPCAPTDTSAWDTAHPMTAVRTDDCGGDNISVAAGRLSFALALHGPCVAYDTACSSSLVASHSAVRARQRHECGDAFLSR